MTHAFPGKTRSSRSFILSFISDSIESVPGLQNSISLFFGHAELAYKYTIHECPEEFTELISLLSDHIQFLPQIHRCHRSSIVLYEGFHEDPF